MLWQAVWCGTVSYSALLCDTVYIGIRCYVQQCYGSQSGVARLVTVLYCVTLYILVFDVTYSNVMAVSPVWHG